MAIKGIIFDMDNTLLRSRINFPLMKQEVFDFLVRNRALPHDVAPSEHTTSSLIAFARRAGFVTAGMQADLEAILTKHETAGMEGAELEPGVVGVLERLHGKRSLVIVTNNAYPAAKLAVERNRIAAFFDHIVAREQMTFMKPAPDGMLAAMKLYPHMQPGEWLSVGDAWIDGKASQDAGIAFVAYRSDLGAMNGKGVFPHGAIQAIGELLPFVED